jgi:hypothetical protein
LNDLVDVYLNELRLALRVDARDEYIDTIAQRIDEGRSALSVDDVEGLQELLVSIGQPGVLAAEFAATEVKLPRKETLTPWQRTRRLALPLSALLAVCLVAGGIVWHNTYQPLTDAGWGTEPILGANGKELAALPVSPGASAYSIPVYAMPRSPSTVRIPVYLSNNGSFPIEITGVNVPASQFSIFGPVRVRYGLASGDGGTRPFRSFDLKGHELRELFISIPMHCSVNPGSSFEIQNVIVDTGFYGASHQVSVPVGPFAIDYAYSC